VNFYFNQLLNQALGGIDAKGLSDATVKLGGVILIASLLYAVYEAYSNGGDVRQLGVAGVKYLTLGLVLNSYPTIFRSISTAFDGISDFMFNLSGVGDVVQGWLNSLSTALGTQGGMESFFGLVTGDAAAAMGVLLMASGYVILPLTYTIFTIAYVLYGSILYVVGPLVLALIPTKTLGKLATTYAVNLMIFHSWALLYAILQVLMSVLNINNLETLASNGSFLNGAVGANTMLLMGFATFVLSLCIALIPFLARHIISGDLGATFLLVAGTSIKAAGLLTKAAFGLAGAGGGSAGAGASSGGGGGGGTLMGAGRSPAPIAGPNETSLSTSARGHDVGSRGETSGTSTPPSPVATASISSNSSTEPPKRGHTSSQLASEVATGG
jgi:hypothetical protein